ncbi:WecB/TagA/CpsF family glycosyltransferase [Falsirhodobacter deserti]|uniref:WecB/TagA/CpsF family glycosyltransferase n=1 Tax=Falsirhodobacter deserti TaxID=1365611 RepID=UPI000FE3A1D5|nr:WecB/TagA/CpsF family glycosyltransferase [Falsirhodobacter deserti]
MTRFVSFLNSRQADAQRAVRITTPNREILFDQLSACMAGRQGFTLATLNLDHVVKLEHDSAFREAYIAHSHVVADGNPIVWLCQIAGYRADGAEVELLPGSELVTPLIAMAQKHDVSVALVGSTSEILAKAAGRIEAAHPGVRVVARIAPDFPFDPQGPAGDAVIEELRASGARMVFLALGAPRQEVFAARAAKQLPECGFASVGAGIDFIAGAQQRAPVWVQRVAMEWAWRMLSNPRRLGRRYAGCFAALPALLRSARSARPLNAR